MEKYGEEHINYREGFGEISELIKHFEVRDDDVFIAAHPKTGEVKLMRNANTVLNQIKQEMFGKIKDSVNNTVGAPQQTFGSKNY